MGNVESEEIHVDELPRWMENLPEKLHSVPLTDLAIPGSHNSFAYYLDQNAPPSPDATPAIKAACAIPGVKRVVNNWSVTQKLDLTQQLKAGIRYFDLRLSVYSKGVKKTNDELHLIHGLYGPRFCDALTDINTFLKDHTQEIVLLDFNHFYQVNYEHHQHALKTLSDIFGAKLCPYQQESCQTGQITLKFMWENSFQVILFYHNDHITTENIFLWPGKVIPSMWPESSELGDFQVKLEQFFTQRQIELPEEDDNFNRTFHVFQGVLSPVASQIVTKFASSLKVQCAEKVAAYFVQWIESKTPGKNGINICIMDFVEMENYIKTVIELNYKLL